MNFSFFIGVRDLVDAALSFVERISRWAVWIGGALVIGAAFLVASSVVARMFFGSRIVGADEVSAYLFAVATSNAMAFTLLRKAHVRVDLLYNGVGKSGRALLDVFALVGTAIFVTIVMWRAFDLFMNSLARGSVSVSPLRVPLAIPQFFWLLGLVVFSVTALVLLFATLRALARGQLEEVSRLAGARYIDAEVDGALVSERANPNSRQEPNHRR